MGAETKRSCNRIVFNVVMIDGNGVLASGLFHTCVVAFLLVVRSIFPV